MAYRRALYFFLGLVCIFSFPLSAALAADITSFIKIAVFPSSPTNLSASSISSSQINLSWTDTSSNEDGFYVERSTTSGTGFSQIATTGANVATYSNTGLSSDTTYFYRVRAFNADGASDYSNEASSTTGSAPAPPAPPPSGGGGGGGGTSFPVETAVIFRGKAYPMSFVTLLKDAQVAATTKAGPDANFEIKLSGLSPGMYVFGVWAEDSKGVRSITHTFSISVTSGATTIVSGIFLPPTISIDKIQVKRGEPLSIFGQSAPSSSVAVFINSDTELVKQVNADVSGVWLYKFDTLEVELGDHTTRARSSKDADITTFSQAVAFAVGTKTVFAEQQSKCPLKGDINGDCRVNLIDFSIAAYWYKRPSPPVKVDLNGDGKVNIVDFSIMAFYWTG